MITSNVEIGTRVKFEDFDMVGTFIGFKTTPVYMKNYCDGFSSIHVNDIKKALFQWDENKDVVCDSDLEIFKCLVLA